MYRLKATHARITGLVAIAILFSVAQSTERALAQASITVPVPIDVQICITDLLRGLEAIGFNNGSKFHVNEYEWHGNATPKQPFFANYLSRALHKGAKVPQPGDKLALLDRATILNSWKSHIKKKQGRTFVLRSLTGDYDLEIIPSGDLEQKLIDASAGFEIAVETRAIRINTNLGPIDSQVISGGPHHMSYGTVEAEIKYLISYAVSHGRKIQNVVVRHLHPSPEFYEIEKQQSHLAFYDKSDFQTMSAISAQLPGVRILDGAATVNGHTYQVEFLGGRQEMIHEP